MNVSFTDSFTLGSEIILRRGATPGNGVIPNTISISAICIDLGASGVFSIKGLHSASKWVSITGPFVIEGPLDTTDQYCYIKASNVSVNIYVKGEN